MVWGPNRLFWVSPHMLKVTCISLKEPKVNLETQMFREPSYVRLIR